MATGQDIVNLVRSVAGQWRYSNDNERLNPRQTGATDCSGVARWAYLEGAGINIGSWTGDESSAGVEIARGHYPNEIPWDSMQPGDLIFMTASYWELYSFAEYLCHVEIYCGNGRMIGHPGGYGPKEKNAQAWMESYGCITWMVRRVLGDGGSAQPTPQGSTGVNIHMQAKSSKGVVLPQVTNNNDDAGDGIAIPYLAAWVDQGRLDVQCDGAGGGILPLLVNPSNINDAASGSVGDGTPMKKLSMYFWSPNGDLAVYYRVMVNGAWLPWMKDHTDLGGSSDKYAGNGRDPIQRVEAYIGYA